MTNIKYEKNSLKELEKYQAITWIGKKRLDALFKGNVTKLIKHLQKEDNVLQGRAVYTAHK